LTISKLGNRIHALAPAIALGALLIVTLIFENAAPTMVVNSVPEEGADCYCHKGLRSILRVNDTEVTAFYPTVDPGSTFTLLIQANFGALDPSLKITPAVGWDTRAADNAKFKFDPTEIVDSSPQDLDPVPGSVSARFKVTAPTEPNYYDLEVTYHGGTSTITVHVGSAVTLTKSFAAIAKVQKPLKIGRAHV
jgi:hypothetical protein